MAFPYDFFYSKRFMTLGRSAKLTVEPKRFDPLCYIMNIKSIQAILPLVENPSRYIGGEVNAAAPTDDSDALRIVLAFPDLYDIGTSHFGLQILYHILNRTPGVVAERVFAPAPDMEGRLRRAGLPLTTLESGRPVGRHHIIGFSLLYELNYTGIPTILDLAGIPLLARQRDEGHPLILAGGPATVNPAPVADLFDAMVIGEGEAVILEIVRAWWAWRAGGGDRSDLLTALSAIEGVYVPAQHSASRVRRRVVPDLDAAPFPDAPVLPFGRPVHDRLRLEIARGCTRGCRFCQAGMIYRPVRERSPERILDLAAASLSATGYEEMSLLALSAGDYTAIADLTARLMSRCEGSHVAISLPSLRAGTLTPELIHQIRRVRKTGFTIAPEAGSQRLRDVINKTITEAHIFDTIADAFSSGWTGIKLYFMIGLPTETDADIDAMIDLVHRAARRPVRGGGRGRRITVSIGTFIPKPHTPFQWAGLLDPAESADRLARLRSALRKPGIQVKWQDPRISLLEGLWARGDRSLSRLLLTAYRLGCRLDGWSDHFDMDRWTDAFEAEGIDPVATAARPLSPTTPLPWDNVDVGVTKAFLTAEWERAQTGELTSDCRTGVCGGCGVCDFETIRPRIHPPAERIETSGVYSKETSEVSNETSEVSNETSEVSKTSEVFPNKTSEVFPNKTPEVSIPLTLTVSRLGNARFFAHLETVKIFTRALRRAGVPVKYSEGFHPLPRISFADPLPIGMESEAEPVHLTVTRPVDPAALVRDVNAELPEGFRVRRCVPRPAVGRKQLPVERTTYRIRLADDQPLEPAAIDRFNSRNEAVLHRTSRKGKTQRIDLKQRVTRIQLTPPNEVRMEIVTAGGPAVRPQEVMREIFGLSEETLKQARVVKTEAQP